MMNLNKQTKTLLVILGVILVAMYLYNYGPIKNAGSLSYEENPLNDYRRETESLDTLAESKEVDPTFDKKVRTKNTASSQFKKASYSEGERSSDVENYFDQGNQLITDAQVGTGTGVNDEFVGNDAGTQQLASYKSTGKKTFPTDEEIFRSEDYLAQEINKDWFEVMPEPVSIKNRHLINVTRPVGVNTVGSTLKNPS